MPTRTWIQPQKDASPNPTLLDFPGRKRFAKQLRTESALVVSPQRIMAFGADVQFSALQGDNFFWLEAQRLASAPSAPIRLVLGLRNTGDDERLIYVAFQFLESETRRWKKTEIARGYCPGEMGFCTPGLTAGLSDAEKAELAAHTKQEMKDHETTTWTRALSANDEGFKLVCTPGYGDGAFTVKAAFDPNDKPIAYVFDFGIA